MNLNQPFLEYRSVKESAFPKSPQIDFTVCFVDVATFRSRGLSNTAGNKLKII